MLIYIQGGLEKVRLEESSNLNFQADEGAVFRIDLTLTET